MEVLFNTISFLDNVLCLRLVCREFFTFVHNSPEIWGLDGLIDIVFQPPKVQLSKSLKKIMLWNSYSHGQHSELCSREILRCIGDRKKYSINTGTEQSIGRSRNSLNNSQLITLFNMGPLLSNHGCRWFDHDWDMKGFQIGHPGFLYIKQVVLSDLGSMYNFYLSPEITLIIDGPFSTKDLDCLPNHKQRVRIIFNSVYLSVPKHSNWEVTYICFDGVDELAIETKTKMLSSQRWRLESHKPKSNPKDALYGKLKPMKVILSNGTNLI
jgi:hypothetical protein